MKQLPKSSPKYTNEVDLLDVVQSKQMKQIY